MVESKVIKNMTWGEKDIRLKIWFCHRWTCGTYGGFHLWQTCSKRRGYHTHQTSKKLYCRYLGYIRCSLYFDTSPPPSFPLLSLCVVNTFSKGLSFLFGKTNAIVNMKITTNNYLSISPHTHLTLPMANYERKQKTPYTSRIGLSIWYKKNPIINMKIITVLLFHTY